jgi:hypothetical protein
LEGKPSPSPKPELPSTGLSGYGQNFSRELDLDNCKPADLLNKVMYHDELEIVGTVVSVVQNWRSAGPKSPVCKAVRLEPWWNQIKDRVLPESFLVRLDELIEITKFSYPLPEVDRALDQVSHSLEKCPACEQPLISLEDGCGTCGYVGKSLASNQTGSLYQYTANRTGKDGIRREYPIIEGRERDRAIDKDWYWGISYVEKVRGKWCDRSASIPRWSLPLARRLMREKFPVEVTISAAQVKWLWTTEIGSYLIGETKPEACPRLAILSFEEKELFVSGPGWGEALPLWRQRRREEIQQAIASGKPFSYIKEILK